jgi:two-component system, LuxR family, response regulator FixJ
MASQLIGVVDDDADVRDSVRFSLETDGFRVRSYANGSDLLQDVELASFDCLIIDYHMPDMNGVELVERLVERDLTTPIILVSSDPSQLIRERASAAGLPLFEKVTLAQTLIERVYGAIAAASLRRG